jgi:hypothetical protein
MNVVFAVKVIAAIYTFQKTLIFNIVLCHIINVVKAHSVPNCYYFYGSFLYLFICRKPLLKSLHYLRQTRSLH